MGFNSNKFFRSTLLLLPAIVVVLLSISIAPGQVTLNERSAVAKAPTVGSANDALSAVPVFTDYRGIRIGMNADEVRAKLDFKDKGATQDFFVFSEMESAQIYYDQNGKVKAISVDYFEKSKAPSPNSILGAELQAKADGSMYQLTRYPDAGYWVSYNRTAGDKPIVTVTMQKM